MTSRNYVTLLFHAAVAVINFAMCFITAWHSLWILSMHDQNHFRRLEVLKMSSQKYSLTDSIGHLLFDVFLIVIFVIQHSGTKLSNLSKFVPNQLDLKVLQRSIYAGLTCFSLQLMMRYWEPVDAFTLWALNTNGSNAYWWLFTLTHVFSWGAIYGEALVMDLGEMIGIKQVYYNLQGLPSPIVKKTPQLRRLYNHMRHGGFTPLAIILWFHPVMRLDRALLALLLTYYMVQRFQIDYLDHEYNRAQSFIKQKELKEIS